MKILCIFSTFVLILHKVEGQGMIQKPPGDIDGVMGVDGLPVVESGKNDAVLEGGKCQWNTLHGVQTGGKGAFHINKWQYFLGDKPFFLKECGACMARADNWKGCPSPSLAWSYDCRSNPTYTVGVCLRSASMYYIFAVYVFPISTLGFIVLWLTCMKLRICPLNMIINHCRKARGRTKMRNLGL